MKQSPLVSVIVPFYNPGERLRTALQSIADQSYAHFEVIAINDGSTDDSDQILGAFPNVRYLKQSNRGPSAARNLGICNASGEFIAFLDADDYWSENKLQQQLYHFEKNDDLQIVTGLVEFTGSNFEKNSEHYNFKYKENRTVHAHLGAGLFRRTAFDRIGLFDEQMRFSEDIDWYNRAKENNLAIKVVEEVSLYLTIHEHSLTHGSSVHTNGTFQAIKQSLDRRRKLGVKELHTLSEYVKK